MAKIDWAAIGLLIVGGINWGLVGFFNFDLVQAISFGVEWISRTIYGAVGVAAIYSIYSLSKTV